MIINNLEFQIQKFAKVRIPFKERTSVSLDKTFNCIN